MHELVGTGLQRERAGMSGPKILLVVGGGIAAYKACELVRLIRRGGGSVTCVLTEGGSQFVTPMALAALSENKVYTNLFDLKDEVEMGHIQLSRAADLVVICPATADLLAKMAAGIADDLASTLILATDKPVLAVPAMNVRMWAAEPTRRNVAWLREAGVEVMEPDEGPMACGEFGPGRLPEPEAVWAAIAARFGLPAPRSAPASEAEGDDEQPVGGLGSLMSSLVPRTTPLRAPQPADEFDDDLLAGTDLAPAEPEGPPVVPDLAGPLMAKKGQARAAPPTDAHALNHMVATGAGDQMPELPPMLASAPLTGQPDFDVDPGHRPLYGRHVLVTAGPTHEPIDPVRYIANRSSGKQGFAIAAAAAALGARVTLVAGPVQLPTPPGVDRVDVESARDMAEAVKQALPADAAVMVAAVADWRSKDYAPEKMKKRGSAPPALLLTENPDILAQVAAGRQRPKLLVGFAAETEDVIANATIKRKRKAVDWIVANDVSGDVMGGDANTVHIVSAAGIEDLPQMPKDQVAMALAERIAEELDEIDPRDG